MRARASCVDAGGLLGRVHNLTLFFCSRSPSRPRRVVFNQWSLAAFERLSHVKLIVQISCGGREVLGWVVQCSGRGLIWELLLLLFCNNVRACFWAWTGLGWAGVSLTLYCVVSHLRRDKAVVLPVHPLKGSRRSASFSCMLGIVCLWPRNQTAKAGTLI